MAGRPGRTQRKLQAQIELGVGESNPLFRQRVFGEELPSPRVITPHTERGLAVTKKQMAERRTNQIFKSNHQYQANQMTYRNTQRLKSPPARNTRGSLEEDVQAIFDQHAQSMLRNSSLTNGRRPRRGSGGGGGGAGGGGGGGEDTDGPPPLFQQIDISNTAYKLRALGFQLSEAMKQYTYDNENNRALIVALLKDLNEQDAEDFDTGKISFLDLMYHPLSPYKIWAYGE